MKRIEIQPGTDIDRAMIEVWSAFCKAKHREAIITTFNDCIILLAPDIE